METEKERGDVWAGEGSKTQGCVPAGNHASG